jgi:hypothetical protein
MVKRLEIWQQLDKENYTEVLQNLLKFSRDQ